MCQLNEEWVEGEAKLVLRELLEAVLVQVFFFSCAYIVFL